MKELGENRGLSIAIIALVYAIATVIGVLAYLWFPFVFWCKLLLADIVATVVVFLFSILFKNASVYDPYWSVQPIVILVAFAFGKTWNVAMILVFIATLVWGFRLTANWVYTFKGLHYQDWRYTMLHEKTGAFYPIINFVGIHLVPTLVVYGCILPAVFTFVYAPKWNVGSVLCFLLSMGAVTLQGIADCQMHAFKKRRTGGFIRDGVWKYARHPNYLGEILMWWGIGLSAVCVMPAYWWLLFGALANTLLFLFVSLPLAEGKLSKREGYAEYKRCTRAFLPLKK